MLKKICPNKTYQIIFRIPLRNFKLLEERLHAIQSIKILEPFWTEV